MIYINAAAMEAIRQSIHNPGRSIFHIAQDISNSRKIPYEIILKQIGKLDLRYKGIIGLGK